MNLHRAATFFFALCAIVKIPTTYASDQNAEQLYRAAEALYEKRGTDLAPVKEALTLLSEAKEKSEGAWKYLVLLLTSRAHYWIGSHTENRSEKIENFQLGMDAATDAFLNVNSEYADAYYYHAINRGRWAEVHGPVMYLKFKDELLENLRTAMSKNTLNGPGGETMNYYGPHRALGRALHKLEGFGGDRALGVQHLRKAYENAKANILNVVFLADALVVGTSAEQAEACVLLKEVLTHGSAEAYTKKYEAWDRLPEAIEEYQMATGLSAKVCL